MQGSSRFSRRTMMKALAGGSISAAAAALLGRMRSAHSAPEDVRRLIVVTAPNDSMFRNYWAPRDANGDTVAIGTLNVPLVTLEKNLAPLAEHTSRIRLFGDVVNQCIKDHNWHADSGHPGLMWLLTGVPTTPRTPTSQKFDELAGGPSVDQYVAQRLGVPSIALGVGTKGSATSANVSYPGANQVVVPFASPTDGFDEIFASFSVDAAEFAARAEKRATVVDLVSRDLGALAPRLPAADRHKLDQHLTALHALEKKLGEKQLLGCAELPPGPDDIDVGKSANLPAVSRAQIDVLVQSFACDLRRVACLQYGDAFYLHPNNNYNWPSEGVATTMNEHDVSHNWKGDSAVTTQRVAIEKFYFSQLAYLIERLAATDQGDGKSLLDTTLILFARPMGNTYHAQDEHLFLFAGGTDFIKTGRFDSMEIPHNQLLAGVCRAMGLDDTSFGHPDYPGYVDLSA